MKLIFLGPPGAGKGTQAERITKAFSIPQISTGEILRAAIREKTQTGLKAQSYIESGALVPDVVVLDIVKERLTKSDCQDGYLLDGFPRTLPQARALDGFARMDAVINLEVDNEAIVKRLSGRRVCEGCGHTTNVDMAKDGSCPVCGKTLVQRADDAEDAVKNRLQVYDAQTKPLIDYYGKTGKMIIIDGDQPIDQVSESILNALRSL